MTGFIERRRKPRPNGDPIDGIEGMTPMERMAAENKKIYDRLLISGAMTHEEWHEHVERKFIENERHQADRNNLTREVIVRVDQLAEIIHKLAATVDKLAVDVKKNDETTNSIALALNKWRLWNYVWTHSTNWILGTIKKYWPGYLMAVTIYGCWHGYPMADNDLPLGRQKPTVTINQGQKK